MKLRRNDLIHRPIETYRAVIVIATGSGMDSVVRRIATFSEDCKKVAREILPTAYPVIAQVSRRPFEEMGAIDPQQLEDEGAREELRAVRDLMSIFDWSSDRLTTSAEDVRRRSAPFFRAIGEAVIAAASLEKVLLADIGVRQLRDQDRHAALAQSLSDLERVPGGRLMEKLRGLGLSGELALRINDVIDRRNDLIHQPIESYDAVAMITTGKDMDAVVRRIRTISEDCDVLAREILQAAYPVIERFSGRSFEELTAILMNLDVAQLEDERAREDLGAAQKQMSALGWS